MGYIIAYDGYAKQFEVRQSHTLRFSLLLAAAFFVFVLLTANFWPQGYGMLRSILIPGDDDLTLQAVENMTQNLKAGASLMDAAEAFCVEVIRAGNVTD